MTPHYCAGDMSLRWTDLRREQLLDMLNLAEVVSAAEYALVYDEEGELRAPFAHLRCAHTRQTFRGDEIYCLDCGGCLLG